MKKFSFLSLLVGLLVFFNSCQKELSYVGGPDKDINTLPAPITATIQGNIIDENGQPAQGVLVSVGNDQATTNAKGYFRIAAASLDRNASVVIAEKAGYFTGYRTFGATSGTNQIMIKLIPKTLAGTIDAGTGGVVSLSNGASISIPANGVALGSANGTAYPGTINVYARFIDPTASDIDLTVPGSFMANDANGRRVTMASYGMIAVELESSTGQPLQLKQGTEATLTMPIPSSLQGTAPATIPLWFVNEATGIWEEEGNASKNGTAYTGKVKHFSFWNCDINIPAVMLTLSLETPDDLPVVHGWVRIKAGASNPYFTQASGFTDSLGQVSGLVPSGYPLVLEILDPCGNVIYTQNIGPFTQNTNLGVITVANTSSSIVTITGVLKNCSGNPVTEGFALIYSDNLLRYSAVNSSGVFTTTITVCTGVPNILEIIGVDETAQQQGNPVSVTVTGNTVNAGNISACGNSAVQFINYTLDGTNFSINNPATDSLMAYTAAQQGSAVPNTYISGFQISGAANIYMRFPHPLNVPGTYELNQLSVGNFNTTTIIQPFNVVITTFPPIGGFYEGNFSGQFKDQANVTHSLSGTFRVRRMF